MSGGYDRLMTLEDDEPETVAPEQLTLFNEEGDA